MKEFGNPVSFRYCLTIPFSAYISDVNIMETIRNDTNFKSVDLIAFSLCQRLKIWLKMEQKGKA